MEIFRRGSLLAAWATLIFLVACQPQVLSGSGKLTYREHVHLDELIEELRSPAAGARTEAAIALSRQLSTEQIKDIGFDGWENADGDIADPDLKALHVLLNNVWTSEADGVIPNILEITDEEWTGPFAHTLYKHGHYDIMYKDGTIQDIMKDLWYEEFRLRYPRSHCWPEMYQHIVDNDWLYERWINDYSLSVIDRCMAATIKGDYEDIIVVQKYWWMRDQISRTPKQWSKTYDFLSTLNDCVENDGNEITGVLTAEYYGGFDLGNKTYTHEFGYLTWAEVICMALDKPDWILDIQPLLEKVSVEMLDWKIDPKDGIWGEKIVTYEDERGNKFIKGLALFDTYQPTKAIEFFDGYVKGKWEEFEGFSVDKRIFQHHSWCENIFYNKQSWEWLNDNFTWTYDKRGQRDYKAMFVNWRDR